MGIMDTINGIYNANTGHGADAGGADYWAGEASLKGWDDATLTTAITNAINPTNTAEWASGQHTAVGNDYTPVTPPPASTLPSNPGDYITGQYQSLFGKDPDQPGLDYWTNELNTGAVQWNDLPRALTSAAVELASPTTPSPTINPGGGIIDTHNGLNSRLPGWFDQLEDALPAYREAYEALKGLPGQIDEWSTNRINQGGVTGDDTVRMLNAVGESRATRGILGGTETENLRAKAVAALSRQEEGRRDGILRDAMTLKTNAATNLPGAALSPVQFMTSLYGTSASEAGGWGNLYANMINGFY